MASDVRPFERYSFVAITTTDLVRARRFWVDGLGCRVTEEEAGHHLIVDAGGLRLCIDLEDGDAHRGGGSDPVIGLKVGSVDASLVQLAARGIRPNAPPTRGARGVWARIADPDGHPVVLTEFD